MKKTDFAEVFIGDFGSIELPVNVIESYKKRHFRKRAPKKSEREARKAMNDDLQAIQRFCWITGMDKMKLPK